MIWTRSIAILTSIVLVISGCALDGSRANCQTHKVANRELTECQ